MNNPKGLFMKNLVRNNKQIREDRAADSIISLENGGSSQETSETSDEPTRIL